MAPAAATTVIGSGAYGVKVSVGVLGFIDATLGPVGAISDATAGAAYDLDNTTAAIGLTSFILASTGGALPLTSSLGIKTGIITTTADAGPLPGTETGDASALVNNLALSLSTKLLGIVTPVLSLGAKTVKSTAAVAGPPASAAGTTSISNLSLTIAGLLPITIGANEFLSTQPNTNLLGFLGLSQLTGLSIILNEQVKGGNNMANSSITTNAIHLIFNNFLIGTKLLTGDIVVSQSRAFINDADSATPEPATWVQMIAGFGLVGVLTRRRRRVVAA